MATNVGLGIESDTSRQHPAIVISEPALVVLIGSDSYRHDLDAVTESFYNDDLDENEGGTRFLSRTTFDVCGPVAIVRSALVSYVGTLNRAARARVKEARKRC
jgi:hypothetical protein